MSKIYQRLTTDLNLYEWTQQDEKDFQLFCEYVWKSDGGRLLLEFSFGKEIKEKIQFIKQIAIDTGFKLKDLLTLFMEKTVFKLFQIIGWSFKALLELIKKGFQAYKDFQLAIADFIGNTKAIEWTKDKLIELDKFLKTHPKTKRIAGVAVAGLLIFIWLQMTFTGDALDDFDISGIFMALSGSYSLYEFFGTPVGIRMLLLFATGAIAGLSFPWPGNNIIKFGIAVLTTMAKYFRKKLSKGNDLEQFESYKRVYKENFIRQKDYYTNAIIKVKFRKISADAYAYLYLLDGSLFYSFNTAPITKGIKNALKEIDIFSLKWKHLIKDTMKEMEQLPKSELEKVLNDLYKLRKVI